MADDFNKDRESEEFRRYREQMHPEQYEEEDGRRRHHPASSMRIIFGIFMVLIYLGMGVLCLINFFGAPADNLGWTIARYVVGIVLIIYGVWRGYRMYAGIDSRI